MTEDADERFNGLNLRAGIKVRKLLVELGIRTEDAEYNLRGVKAIFNLFVIVIVVCKVVIPSREKRQPASSFRRFKQGIQEFHRIYVLIPADKTENSVQLHFFNILSKSFMVQKPTNYIFRRMRSMWLMNIAAIEPLS